MSIKREHVFINGIESKACCRCAVVLPLSDFSIDKRKADGLNGFCKKCHNISSRKYYFANKPKIYKKNREWIKNNLERFRHLQRKSDRKLFKTPKHRIKNAMSCRIRGALRNNISGKSTKNGASWIDLVGYSLEDLMAHLESMFDERMSWRNYGEYWEIDHVIPIDSFSFKHFTDDGFVKCWSLKNLQPLSVLENRIKSNKIKGE